VEIIQEEVEEMPIVVEKVLEKIPPVVEIPTKPESTVTFSDINVATREALVNILCLTSGPHIYINPISGSGTIIDERGVILTNAHIAQFYLFENYPSQGFVNCLIRMGSPARAMYHAELLYISPKWIDENTEAFSTENPAGTGEDDFALLLITEPVSGVAMPETFPYVGIDKEENSIVQDDALLIAGYPAGFLGGTSVHKELYASSAITKALELYTFETGSLDIISLGGTVVAQQGSSGGPAVNEYGNVIGLISTASEGETTGERELRAITLEHIERSLFENSQTTLAELLSGNLKEKTETFNATTAPLLLEKLISSF